MNKSHSLKLIPRLLVLGLFVLCLALFSMGSPQSLFRSPIDNNEKDLTQQQSNQNRRAAQSENDFPIADYSATEPTDHRQREQRDAKGLRYNRHVIKIRENAGESIITESENPLERLPPLPVIESDLILTGKILNAQSYLSQDKSGVYSEFEVSVDEILKQGAEHTLFSGSSIIIERPGGRVRFASGHVQLYTSEGQGMPLLGNNYLMFLRRVSNAGDYLLLTAYSLKLDGVIPVDHFQKQLAFEGQSPDALLSTARKGIAESQPDKQP